VARYGKEQKQATRRRILDSAGRRFKRSGIDGSGISTLMADAGLTNGAFYAHFASKGELVAATIGEEMRVQCEAYASALAADPAGLETLIREYLSPQHRDHPEEGCPSAALLCELGRGGSSAKRSYTEGMLAIADAMAGYVPVSDRQAARLRVLNVFAFLLGTLQISRAIDDRSLADEILEQGIGTALALLRADTK